MRPVAVVSGRAGASPPPTLLLARPRVAVAPFIPPLGSVPIPIPIPAAGKVAIPATGIVAPVTIAAVAPVVPVVAPAPAIAAEFHSPLTRRAASALLATATRSTFG